MVYQHVRLPLPCRAAEGSTGPGPGPLRPAATASDAVLGCAERRSAAALRPCRRSLDRPVIGLPLPRNRQGPPSSSAARSPGIGLVIEPLVTCLPVIGIATARVARPRRVGTTAVSRSCACVRKMRPVAPSGHVKRVLLGLSWAMRGHLAVNAFAVASSTVLLRRHGGTTCIPCRRSSAECGEAQRLQPSRTSAPRGSRRRGLPRRSRSNPTARSRVERLGSRGYSVTPTDRARHRLLLSFRDVVLRSGIHSEVAATAPASHAAGEPLASWIPRRAHHRTAAPEVRISVATASMYLACPIW